MTSPITGKFVLVLYASLSSEWFGTHAIRTFDTPMACEEVGEQLPPSAIIWSCLDGPIGAAWQQRERLLFGTLK